MSSNGMCRATKVDTQAFYAELEKAGYKVTETADASFKIDPNGADYSAAITIILNGGLDKDTGFRPTEMYDQSTGKIIEPTPEQVAYFHDQNNAKEVHSRGYTRPPGINSNTRFRIFGGAVVTDPDGEPVGILRMQPSESTGEGVSMKGVSDVVFIRPKHDSGEQENRHLYEEGRAVSEILHNVTSNTMTTIAERVEVQASAKVSAAGGIARFTKAPDGSKYTFIMDAPAVSAPAQQSTRQNREPSRPVERTKGRIR